MLANPQSAVCCIRLYPGIVRAAAKVDVGMGTDPKESAPVVPTLLIDVRGAQAQNRENLVNYNSMMSDDSSGSLGNVSGLSTDEHSLSGTSKGDMSSGSASLFNDTVRMVIQPWERSLNQGICQM